jgi:predicted amidohydrolase YtcJ
VEPINPLLGIWAAVTRKRFPEENLTMEEAVKTYTLNAAHASFDENRKGTIEVGKFGDLTILSGRLDVVSPERIKDISVQTVLVDGKVVYAREQAA